jgi:hypothetical protein
MVASMAPRSRGLLLSIPLLALSLLPREALAQEAGAAVAASSGDVVGAAQEIPSPADLPDEAEKPFLRHPLLGFAGGVGFATVKHPQLITPHVYGPVLSAFAGYAFSPRWSGGLQFTTMTWTITRRDGTEPFAAAASWLHTEADCTKCAPPPEAGATVKTTMLASTAGPWIDVTPFGRDGLYLGASGGLAMFSGSQDLRLGGGGSAHVGFRATLVDLITIGVEGGVQGQAYPDASVVLGYGALSVGVAVFKGLPPSQISAAPDRAR